jgi:hypothetical protein
MQIKYKKMGAYAATDGKDIYLNPSKNRNGIERLDSILHEKNHIKNMKMSESKIEEKTRKDRLSTLAII